MKSVSFISNVELRSEEGSDGEWRDVINVKRGSISLDEKGEFTIEVSEDWESA